MNVNATKEKVTTWGKKGNNREKKKEQTVDSTCLQRKLLKKEIQRKEGKKERKAWLNPNVILGK